MIGPGIPNPLLLSGGDPLDEFGKIDRSLRLRASVSADLRRNFGSAGNQKKFAWSGWMKRGEIKRGIVFGSVINNMNYAHIDFGFLDSDVNCLNVVFAYGNIQYARLKTLAACRDPSADYHIYLEVDTDHATAGERLRLWINGERMTALQNTIYPASGTQLPYMNTAIEHRLGGEGYYTTNQFDGMLSHVAFVDGANPGVSAFGFFHPRTGQWRPRSKAAVKAIVDAGGANSFFLPFDDITSTTTLCADASSKANHWTPTNISLTPGITYDSLIDTPTTNYPTLDPNFAVNGFIAGNITDGGLKFAASTTYHFTPCTIPLPASGKWYAEFIPQDTVSFIGVADLDNGSGASQNIGSGYGWYGNVIYTGNASAVIGGLPAMAANDIIGVAVDMSVPQVQWYRNGTLVATQALSNLKRYAFACGDYYAPGATSCFANFGQRPFSHLPSGYKPLCAKNLKYDGTAQTATAGTFIGNGAADGPSVYINGCPETLTINGNAVVFGVHADRLANGFKIRTASASYNAGGSNTWSATLNAAPLKSLFRFQNAKGN